MALAGKFAGIFNNLPINVGNAAAFNTTALPQQLDNLSNAAIGKLISRGNSLGTATVASNNNQSGIGGFLVDYGIDRAIDRAGSWFGKSAVNRLLPGAAALIPGAALLPEVGAAAITGIGSDMMFPTPGAGSAELQWEKQQAQRNQRIMNR